MNGQNQRWSKWTIDVTTAGVKRPSFGDVRENAARFARLVFGSATAMKVEQLGLAQFRIQVRTEGHPVHDPAFAAWMAEQWTTWALKGFGLGANVTVTSKLESGSRQDGTPPDQLILAPSIPLGVPS